MNSDCVFCKIVHGHLPSIRVYEDERVLAFMDIGPIVKGHTLVIPKEHYDPITQTPTDVLQHLIAVVQRIVRAHYTGLKADGVNVTQANGAAAGQIIPHIHFHVIPRFLSDGHHWNWTPRHYLDRTEMQEFATSIKEALAPSGNTEQGETA